MDNDNAKILVEIAAYRDPDLLDTIKSALIQADHPGRVRFSICYQGDELEDFSILKGISYCKIKHLKESETQGTCLARYLCQQMLEDEDYVFQIDAHMRFIKHWDSKMIEQLLSLNDKKATISFYPPPMSEEMETKPLSSSLFDNPYASYVNIAREFCNPESYFVVLDSVLNDRSEKQTVKAPFVAGGNFFSFSEAHKEVLHDPEMCWSGDEFPMSIRYYTHGWNNYSSKESYIYHKYMRKNRAIPKYYAIGKEKEEKRLKQLLGIEGLDQDLGQFGLGKQRTLKQFEDFSGIDFANRIIHEKAKTGQFN